MSKRLTKEEQKSRRDLIRDQILEEIAFARRHKQGKIMNWKKNEAMYYGRKNQPETSRSNVELGRMAEFVHTLLSKIDNPLSFKFTKRKEAQVRRVTRLNGIRQIDQQNDNWDMKDLVGKKQAVIYGRAVYSYYADSIEGIYAPHLDNIDVYDFLIDPAAGGIDIEKADYLGDYGLTFYRKDLEAGAKDGTFLKEETTQLLNGTGNATESSQEQTNKQDRTYDTGVYQSQKQIENKDKFKFWRWGTTYEGERYYAVITEDGGQMIRLEKLADIFDKNLWWYWSWAAFPDLTEFWTPSYCDYVREIFMAQSVSINQSLDNSEEVTKPQKIVNVAAIEDLASLKYKRGGYIKVKKDFDVNKAVQTINVPSIDTPIKMFQLLETIQEKASGVTAAAKGVAENDSETKATIYQGNEANTADRFGLLNKSYAYGYKRFALLWKNGVNEHLNKKIAIDILGPDGVDVEMVSRRDIFRRDEDFGLLVEASDAELMLSAEEKKAKIEFLDANAANPNQNQKKAYEIGATIAGFREEDIRELMDTSDFGNAALMAEAERDIERLLDGEKIEPNMAATTAYKQRFVDYMIDHKEDLKQDQFMLLADYVLLLDPIITKNMVRMANAQALRMTLATPPAAGGTKPVTPGSEVATPANPGAGAAISTP